MRTKKEKINAIIKRFEEIMEATAYLQEFTITIKGGVNEITTIKYDITEAVKDWSEKK